MQSSSNQHNDASVPSLPLPVPNYDITKSFKDLAYFGDPQNSQFQAAFMSSFQPAEFEHHLYLDRDCVSNGWNIELLTQQMNIGLGIPFDTDTSVYYWAMRKVMSENRLTKTKLVTPIHVLKMLEVEDELIFLSVQYPPSVSTGLNLIPAIAQPEARNTDSIKWNRIVQANLLQFFDVTIPGYQYDHVSCHNCPDWKLNCFRDKRNGGYNKTNSIRHVESNHNEAIAYVEFSIML